MSVTLLLVSVGNRYNCSSEVQCEGAELCGTWVKSHIKAGMEIGMEIKEDENGGNEAVILWVSMK